MKLQGILSGCSTVFFSCELLWHIVTPFPSTRCRCRFREPLYGIRSFGSFLRKHRYNSHGPRVAFVVVMTTARPPYSCFLIPLVLFGQLGTRGKKKKKKSTERFHQHQYQVGGKVLNVFWLLTVPIRFSYLQAHKALRLWLFVLPPLHTHQLVKKKKTLLSECRWWSLSPLWSQTPGVCGILGNTAITQVTCGLLKHFFFFLSAVTTEEKTALMVLRYCSSHSASLEGAFIGSSRASGLSYLNFFPLKYVYINRTLARSSPFLFSLQ